MKTEYGEMKRSHGEIRLVPESLDDLWHLEHLVAPGGLVFATTFRSLEGATDKLRPEKSEKKPMRLGIRVEKVAFDRNANRIRISGLIEHGVDLGLHHTLNVETGTEVSVIKTWRSRDFERIRRAEEASAQSVVYVLSIEEAAAEIFRIRQFGPEQIRALSGGSGKREESGGRIAFFEDVLSAVGEIPGSLVIAGPGFVKDEFYAFLRSKSPDIAERALLVETRRIGRGAVQDLIGQGVLERITQDLQLTREVRLIEELLRRISQEGNAAYGVQEVTGAIGYGAAETVLVTDELVRNAEISDLLERAERTGASIVVFSTEFDPGVQLESLGGVAALLRFAIR